MKATLKVKNFGPIKDVELDLRDVNVFIGPQASGKSVLAKLYTICKSLSYFCSFETNDFPIDINSGSLILHNSTIEINESKFFDTLAKFSLITFLQENTVIIFECESHSISVNGKRLIFQNLIIPDLKIKSKSLAYAEELSNVIDYLSPKSKFLNTILQNSRVHGSFSQQKSEPHLYTYYLSNRLACLDSFIRFYFSIKCHYIPSERTLAVLLKKSALNLMHQKVPIPEHLLEFAANYNTASDKVKKLDLSYLKSTANYQNIDGEDFILDDGTTLKLSESASGLQSVVPLLITLEHMRSDKEDNKFHQAFVIEEPETNLFPKAQYALLKYLEKNRPDDDGKIDTGSVHIYTTHSPFILSSLNNMLYAYKKGYNAFEKIQDEIGKILPKENWIAPERFSAYQIIDGKAESIFDRESGLIQENIIDQISEDIMEDFRSIAIATMEE